MTNSYKKESFFKRMFNELFHKTKMLDIPLEYTQKEIKEKEENIINFLSCRKVL